MIESKDNDKLKLVRKLHERRHREREGLFIAEGEDLLKAAAAEGVKPALALVAAGIDSGAWAPDALEVEPDVLAGASTLGSGTRAIGVFEARLADPGGPVCVYLHAVGDPGNVGAVIRTVHGLVEGTVVLGPDCADPFSPKAVRASMGSIFGQPVARGVVEQTPEPRFALAAHGGRPLREMAPPLTLCLGAERDGLPAEVTAACEGELTIPLRAGGAESLNVAAAAAIALGRAVQQPSERIGSEDA